MTLSEVFYEAACRMSTGFPSGTSTAVFGVRGRMGDVLAFLRLMEDEPGSLGRKIMLATPPGWDRDHYRTFMLLMASEAVK